MDSNGDLTQRVVAWTHILAPWIDCLRSRITLPVDSLVNILTIHQRLWFHFDATIGSNREDVGTATTATRLWMEWLEAFELFNLLARVDPAVCWTLLVEVCNASASLRRHGAPTELFLGVQPRYEIRIPYWSIPNDATLERVLGTRPYQESAAFARAKSLIETTLEAETNPEWRRSSPIRMRFLFKLPYFYAPLTPETQHDTSTRACLNRVLALARALRAARIKSTMPRFVIPTFGFHIPPCAVKETSRSLLSLIADDVPIFSLTYGNSCSPSENFFGPYLWTLLAPRSVLGVRKLEVSSLAAHDAEIVALCSAIGQSTSLREFSYHDHTDSDGLSWSPFLAFALFRKSATHRIHSVRLSFRHSSLDKAVRVLRETNPVVYLAGLHDGYAKEGAYNWPPPTVMRERARARSSMTSPR